MVRLDGKPNEGLRLTAERVAQGIRDRELGETIAYGVADPAIFTADGGPSIGERMYAEKVLWRRADNKRTSQVGAMGGWDQMRSRIEGHQVRDDAGQVVEEGPAMIFAFTTCADSIRTIPALQHDPDKLEDLDSDMEDHAADEWRYACMSRPMVARRPKAKAPPLKGIGNTSFDQLLKQQDARKNARV